MSAQLVIFLKKIHFLFRKENDNDGLTIEIGVGIFFSSLSIIMIIGLVYMILCGHKHSRFYWTVLRRDTSFTETRDPSTE